MTRLNDKKAQLLKIQDFFERNNRIDSTELLAWTMGLVIIKKFLNTEKEELFIDSLLKQFKQWKCYNLYLTEHN